MVKKLGLFVKLDAEAATKADEFEAWLTGRGVSVVRKESPATGRKFSNKRDSKAPSDLFCIFVLGGDGTFLSAVHWIGEQDIPVIGIKFGRVGFLAEITEDQLYAAARNIIEKGFTTEPRMRLSISVFRNNSEIAKETVLNDVVINRGALARLSNIKSYINDNYLTTFKADGLIVSTPTGSTAYSLAAGGPVIHPAVPGIIMTPICPFTLTNRPLIISDTDVITIRLGEKSSDIMLTFDGQTGLAIDENDIIVIKKGGFPVRLITMPGQNYFDVLKAKLRWSGGQL